MPSVPALIGTGTGAHPPTPSPSNAGQSSPATPPPAREHVQVWATTPVTPAGGGQQENIYLNSGQALIIHAAGYIQYGYEGTPGCTGYPYVDPSGNRILPTGQSCPPKYDSNMPDPGAPVGALLWRVGTGAWQLAGRSAHISAPDSGPLYLGVNDDLPGDNSGDFVVILTLPSSS